VGFGCGWAKLNVVFLGRQVRWQNTSFNFAKRWHFRPLFLSVCCRVVGRLTLACNGLRAGEVFYFGLSVHCFIVKNIAIKLNKFLPKTILQYFFLQEGGAR
jgi:hypothetical protein